MNFLVMLKLMEVAATLIAQGKSSVAAFRGFLAQEGATPEQLAALDARLTTEIEERELARPSDE